MMYRLCRKCNKPIVPPAVYCEKCNEKVIKQQEEYKTLREKRYNKNRNPKYKQFYNSNDWKILKEKKLFDCQYQCEICKGLATEVHHIKPIQTIEGWIRRLDYFNLEALCTRCHNYRHKRFQQRQK